MDNKYSEFVWLKKLWIKLWYQSEWLLKEGHLRAGGAVIGCRQRITEQLRERAMYIFNEERRWP